MCARRFESINNNFRSNQIDRSQGKNFTEKIFKFFDGMPLKDRYNIIFIARGPS